MKLIRQLTSFGLVGTSATIVHVGVAWLLMHGLSTEPFLANAVGAVSAFLISLFGNARFSFEVSNRIGSYAGRYGIVSAISLLLTTTELWIVRYLELPSAMYVVVVLLTVPPVTFVIAKFWVFRDIERLHRIDHAARGKPRLR